MKHAFIDSSCVVAVIFGESGAKALQARLKGYDALYASPLLEAEVWATLARERVPLDASLFDDVNWVVVDRPLSAEIERVLSVGYVRGADCWHLATALYLAPQPAQLTFLTLDTTQRKIAKSLGFALT